MERFCPKCGAPLRESSKFCQKCGQSIAMTNEAIPKVQSMSMNTKNNNNKESKNLITILVIIVLLLGAGGGYYYTQMQQQQEQALADKKAAEDDAARANAEAEVAKSAAEQAKSDNEIKIRKEKDKAYIKNAIVRLEQGETDLANLSSSINSGKNTKAYLLRVESNIVSAIEGRRSNLKQQVQPETASLINEADILFSLQINRANCMFKGIQGDTSQYAVGGNYYEEFQNKYNVLKKANDL